VETNDGMTGADALSRPAAAPVIVLRNLDVTFPGRGGETVEVLRDINLEVFPGEFVCVVGPSGCGKSTLLNILGGFLACSQGQALVQGEPVHGPDRRRIFVFQDSAVFPWLNVWDNVGFGLDHLAREARTAKIQHYLDMVGLTGFEKAYARELSGGMRQRVELARALAANPQILYMDEPFGALDYLTRLKMRRDLIAIWEAERKTVVFVTHDIDEAVQLADRVVVLGPRPARIHAVLSLNFPRPRDLNAPEYLAARDRIFAAMGTI
jgi:NitT/TauT family transport system ATP-binding protein